MKRHSQQSGFTLLELVLVMVIIIVAMALAAPNMGGWKRSNILRNSADEFLMLTRYARSQAIAKGKTHRIEIDTNTGVYQLRVQEGLEFTEIGSQFGRKYTVVEGGRFELKKITLGAADQVQANDQALYFYPTGRTHATNLRILDKWGYVIEIDCPTPAEDFRIIYEGAAS